MVSDAVMAFGIVWLPGILMAIPVWRTSRPDADHSSPSLFFRALYLGIIFAPSVIHAHGDYYVPALWYILYPITGDLLASFPYGVVPILVTSSLFYAILFFWFLVGRRTRPGATKTVEPTGEAILCHDRIDDGHHM